MDLNKAIKIVSELIQQAKSQPKKLIFIVPHSEFLEAVEICLEAAKDKTEE